MKNEGEQQNSDSDDDSDSAPLIAMSRGSSRAGSRSPSSARGSPRQRKKAEQFEQKSRSQLKKLCKDNDLEKGSTEEMVARVSFTSK